MFETWQVVHFCPATGGVDQSCGDGFSTEKKCEWLSAIELPKYLLCNDWPSSKCGITEMLLIESIASHRHTDDQNIRKVRSEQYETS